MDGARACRRTHGQVFASRQLLDYPAAVGQRGRNRWAASIERGARATVYFKNGNRTYLWTAVMTCPDWAHLEIESLTSE